MYVELDHNLVPRKIEDVIKRNESSESEKETVNIEVIMGKIEDFSKRNELSEPLRDMEKRFGIKKKKSNFDDYESNFDNYDINCKNMQTILKEFDRQRQIEKKVEVKEYEAVIGPNEDICFDYDWGFLSAILASYNNHWVLKTCPDDWWNVIVRNVAQVVDEKGDLPNVRNFFVDHDGKKTIGVEVPDMAGIDYSWLFDQFSTQIKKNIKTPGYVDVVQADFSTTTPTQLISTQIMLMASVQKYFEFMVCCECGIPGIEMTGTQEDWEKLVEKLDRIEALLQPIMKELELEKWFGIARKVVSNLLDSYRGEPDKEWWSHILSKNVEYGSGPSLEWWTGWITEFLMATQYAANPRNFPRGVVSVPVKFNDNGIEDTGVLVAGTVGYTVEEGDRAPLVVAKQGWSILMPQGSPITPRLLGK